MLGKPDFGIKMSEVHMDNAATTLVDDEVVKVMQPYLEERYGNPETPHHLGRESAEAVDQARENVAELMDAEPDRVFFTSGGTEANNWAIKCGGDGGVAVSVIEHPSVLYSATSLTGTGLIKVNAFGKVDLDSLKKHLESRAYKLVSIQHSNNEIGTLQPIEEVVALCRQYGVLCHMDAVQSYGKVPFSVQDLDVDMVSVSAHKIHGPMGIGALYVRQGLFIQPLLHGGGQESGMRSGTTAVHLVAGFGKAAELAWTHLADMDRVFKIRKFIEGSVQEKFDVTINGHPTDRLPTILSVTIPGMEASLVAAALDHRYGLMVACGAACSTRSGGSHVLAALGMSLRDIRSTLRISLSRMNTMEQAKVLTATLGVALKDAEERKLD